MWGSYIIEIIVELPIQRNALPLPFVKVKKIVMGLDKFKRTPCGFCFVEYYLRLDK